VCFRYRGLIGCGLIDSGMINPERIASEGAMNRFNAALLKRIIVRGRIYLSNASLGGKFSLRACIVNHRTKDSDIDAVIPEVLAAVSEVA
jgi:hypothetical protein